MKCVFCKEELGAVNQLNLEHCVSSDHRPIKLHLGKTQCPKCFLMQAVRTKNWYQQVNYIYESYRAYEISMGSEQLVFQSDGIGNARSDVLVRQVVKESGTRLRWLDFGAGDGTLLETVHRIDPEASLFAYDLSTQAEQAVRSRAPISGFYSSMAEIGTDYDVIILSHVLEHVDNPRAVLVDLIERLSTEGQIVIQVPNVGENPFDLVVFDHVSHFDQFTLEALLQSVGQLNFLSTETVAKEIVASIGRDKSRQGSARTIEFGVGFDTLKTTNSIDFMSQRLWRVAEASRREHLNIGALGIFGTSIAANWVSGFLGDRQTFWVDEDPARIGKTWQGKQIMDLDQMANGASLLVPFVGGLGTNLLDRILSAATSQRIILL